jgi:hypothetical protein
LVQSITRSSARAGQTFATTRHPTFALAQIPTFFQFFS